MDDLFFSEERLKEKYATACLLCADFAKAGGKKDITAQLIDSAISGMVESESNPVEYMGNTEDIRIN
jgi:hypothetical protein